MFNHFFHNSPGKKKVVLSFSGGKDSILTLYKLMSGSEYEVVALLTTLDSDNRVLMHGFDSTLLELQALSIGPIGIPLHKVIIPKAEGEKSRYAEKMKEELEKLKTDGVTHVAYGDIFLEDVRKFREEKLSMVGMASIFPLWGINTTSIAEEFITLGFRAIITCVNTKLIPASWVGKEFDREFVTYLIAHGIDPCGENGEFHTLVYAGPIFKEEIKYQLDLDNPLIHNEFYACVAKPRAITHEGVLKS